jgi:mannitol/fructose-specific phosphotransferase system IIA component (Ntr-type)
VNSDTLLPAVPNLADTIAPSQIIVPLVASSRDEAIDALLEVLDLDEGTNGGVDLDRVRQCLIEREAEITTGIGRGVAFPHARTDAVTGHHVALGIAGEPIDFDAIDGQPCRIVLLCVFHPDAERQHSHFIAQVAGLLNDESRGSALAAADSVAAAHAAL